MKTKTRKYGQFAEERCPYCARFVPADADGYYDRENREDECSPVLIFCSEEHAEKFHARKDISAALHQVETTRAPL
jgi:hypothetical protein